MKHTSKELKNRICPAPFKDFMVLQDHTNVCCPEWFDKDKLIEDFPEQFEGRIGMGKEEYTYACEVSRIKDRTNLMEEWNNPFHKALRESIISGEYTYCSRMCPYVDKVYREPLNLDNYLVRREDLEEYHGNLNFNNPLPLQIYFNFDKACNLKCPSCRVELYPNGISPKAQETLDSINRDFSKNVEHIVITGSGDPFYSNIFRKWLFNFDSKMYPNLEEISLISNGNMFTQKTWESLGNVKPYLKGMEWSIDAGTKDTYENKTRLNGRWDVLIKNMEFLATLNHFQYLVFSFVVQKDNYTEMETFCKLINNKFKDTKCTYKVLFRALQDWGHQSNEWFKENNVCDINHPLHSELITEIEKIHKLPYVESNLYQFVQNFKK